MTPRQLALDFPALARDPALTYVEAPSQAAARTALARWRDWPAGALALVGPTGSGKSHLAALWARAAEATVVLGSQIEAAPDTGAIVVEDADQALACGDLSDRALMAVLERARAGAAGPVLFTARTAPVAWGADLPDVVSRLALVSVISIDDPEDEDLRSLLVKHLGDRGVPAEPSLIEYLLRRIERSFVAAEDVIAQLDRAALERKQRITRHLAREVLGGFDVDEPLTENGTTADERQEDEGA